MACGSVQEQNWDNHSDAQSMQTTQLPKILQRKRNVWAILAFVIAILVYGYQWLKDRDADIDIGSVQSKGWIGMISLKNSGSVAAVLKPDGTIIEAKDAKPDSTDRDVVWRPDGNRIFFSSDRESGAYNIFRWNLASDVVMRRTLGKISKSDPSFLPDPKETNPLFVYGGLIWELDPKSGKASKKFPPDDGTKKGEVALNEEGSGENVGSFGMGAEIKARTARYIGDREYIAFIRKNDEGEQLVVAKADSAKPEDRKIVAVGEKISFDVDQVNKRVIYTVAGFHWPNPAEVPPQFIKKDRMTVPFQHLVALYDVTSKASFGPTDTIATSADDKVAFSSVQVSPDGKTLVLLVGPYASGGVEGRMLVRMPAKNFGSKEGGVIAPTPNVKLDGVIYTPSWSPDSSKVVFAVAAAGGKRDICEINADGSGFTNLTNGKGTYTSPVYSPQ